MPGTAHIGQLLVEQIGYNAIAPVLFWAALANRKALLRLAGGNPLRAAYIFGAFHLIFMALRVWGTHRMCESPLLGSFTPLPIVGMLLFVVGQVLNIFVYYRLGVSGVYYATAFGAKVCEGSRMPRAASWPTSRTCLLSRVCAFAPAQLPWVEGFPFNIVPHPQYFGATLSTLGTALWAGTVSGLMYSLGTVVSYYIAVECVEKKQFGHIERELKAQKAAKKRKAA